LAAFIPSGIHPPRVKEARKEKAMLKIKLASASLGFAIISSAVVQAQNEVAPAAPLPSQILTAKKAFISNAGGDLGNWRWSGGQARTYNEFTQPSRGGVDMNLGRLPATLI
jgi:hypothetical protein